MSHKPSGLWCDLCKKPIFHDPYWHCAINGKPGHSCDKCKTEWEIYKDEVTPTPPEPSETEER